MKVNVLHDIDNYRYYKENNLIYCKGHDNIYQLLPISQYSDFLVMEHCEETNENQHYMLTTDEHHKLLNIKLVQATKLDMSTKTRSEERVLSILQEAIKQNASDIHFIREEDIAQIRLRVNGQLDIYLEVAADECDEILFVLYNVMASTKETTWNTKTPQDANIVIDINLQSYRFRYSHMPIFTRNSNSAAYHAVVRVIYPNKDKSICSNLNLLNLFPEEELIIDKILSNPSGLFIVSGVTGSGKSTSLKNYMEYVYHTKYDQKGCFVTVEDPVEYVIHGAQQSSVVKSKEGENLFSDAVRSAMRRDPDVLMIGEIRDHQTGDALASAVETGHLCLTTIHAGNVIGVLQRLNGLGIGMDKLISPGFIVGITNQKLLPVICPHCSNHELNEFKRVVKIQGDGCVECDFHGIVSRQLVMEQLIPDLHILKYLSEQDWIETYKYYRTLRRKNELGEGYTIKDKIYYHCLRGTCCYSFFKSSYGIMEESDELLVHSVFQSKK